MKRTLRTIHPCTMIPTRQIQLRCFMRKHLYIFHHYVQWSALHFKATILTLWEKNMCFFCVNNYNVKDKKNINVNILKYQTIFFNFITQILKIKNWHFWIVNISVKYSQFYKFSLYAFTTTFFFIYLSKRKCKKKILFTNWIIMCTDYRI